jgi:hypothetical protein
MITANPMAASGVRIGSTPVRYGTMSPTTPRTSQYAVKRITGSRTLTTPVMPSSTARAVDWVPLINAL